MRISVFCRCFLCCMLVSLLLVSAALADVPDLSGLTDDEIVELLGKVNEELVSRGISKSAVLPAGKYIAGKDLPAGSYIIVCKTDDNHHGIVWAAAATDDLNNQYPSLLYEHVSFNCEEQFRITLDEGGILNLPFTATLTVSPGLLFK